MASGVMPPVGDVACIPSEASKQLSEQPCKRAKHSALDNVTQLFQQVILAVRATLQHIASNRALVCVAQVVQKLEASRQRQSKWTVREELALLCESWSRAARREPSTAFAFKGHSAKAVMGKLQHLKTILPSEIINLPSWTPPELLRDTLARGKLLLEIADQLLQCKDGRS